MTIRRRGWSAGRRSSDVDGSWRSGVETRRLLGRSVLRWQAEPDPVRDPQGQRRDGVFDHGGRAHRAAAAAIRAAILRAIAGRFGCPLRGWLADPTVSGRGEAAVTVRRASCGIASAAATALGLAWPECACTGMAQPSDNRTTSAIVLIAWTRIPNAVTTLRRFVPLRRSNEASHWGRSTAFGCPCALWLQMIERTGQNR